MELPLDDAHLVLIIDHAGGVYVRVCPDVTESETIELLRGTADDISRMSRGIGAAEANYITVRDQG